MGFEAWLFHGSVLFYLLTAAWSVGYFISNRVFRLRWAQGFLLTGFIMETVALIARGYASGRPPIFERFELGVLIAWALVACCLAVSYFYRVRLIIPFAMPLVAILYTVSVVNFSTHGQLEKVGNVEMLKKLWEVFHVGAVIASLGCFVLSFATSLMYLMQERKLKAKSSADGWATRLPALEKLDRLGYGSIGIGLLLLTLGIVIPMVMDGGDGESSGPDSLVIWGFTLWAIYTALFVARARTFLAGRKLAVATVFGAVVGALAYPGIRFILSAGLGTHQLF